MWPDDVGDALEALRARAAATPLGALRDGSWLLPWLRDSVDDHAAQVDRTWLEDAHPGLDDEGLADARIADAQLRAGIAGGLSAGAYASVVMATLATGGLVGAALPAAVAAMAVDLLYLTRLQLCLAWDLSVVYRQDLDPARDDDLWTLSRVAFGIDDDDDAAALAKPATPLASRFGSRAISTAARLAVGVQAVGRSLAWRSLAKFAIPAAGVPMCAAVNHVTTGAVGRAARAIFRDRAAGHALARELAEAEELALAAIVLVLRADGRLDRAETALIDGLARGVGEDPTIWATRALEGGEDALIARVAAAPADVRAAVVEAARRAADLDGVRVDAEDALIARLVGLSG